MRIPKLGVVKTKGQLPLEKIKRVTIRLSATVSMRFSPPVETEIQELFKAKNVVGIDMGVADLRITSDGMKYPIIRFNKILAKKKHYW